MKGLIILPVLLLAACTTTTTQTGHHHLAATKRTTTVSPSSRRPGYILLSTPGVYPEVWVPNPDSPVRRNSPLIRKISASVSSLREIGILPTEPRSTIPTDTRLGAACIIRPLAIRTIWEQQEECSLHGSNGKAQKL